jgi:hypothetical protein
MIDNLTPPPTRLHPHTITWFVAFAVVYDIGVLGLQVAQWFVSPQAGVAIDEYSGAIAVALCVTVAILIFRMTGSRRLRMVLLAAAAVFALLTVDDVFALHERMNNDDYLAVALWLMAGSVLLVLLRLERPGRAATAAICAGFFLHGFAALADGADGGIFTLDMISPFELGLSREILELAYMGLYLVGFSQMLSGRRTPGDVAHAISGAEATVAIGGPLAEDRELLELESWYWAWRSHTQSTDDAAARSAGELFSVVGKLAALPSQSIRGVSAKLRVFQDMIGSGAHARHPESDAQARLLEGIVIDANRLAETGI